MAKRQTTATVAVSKASRQGPIIVDSLFGHSAIEPPRETSEYLKVYEELPWVYACCYTISASGANLPLRVFRKLDETDERLKRKSATIRKADSGVGPTDGETADMGAGDEPEEGGTGDFQPRGTPTGWDDVTDEPDKYDLVRILQNPNPAMTTYDLIETTLGFLELTGDMYWEIADMANGLPGELWPMRPDRVSINPTKTTPSNISSYTYKVGNRSANFSTKEVVPFRYFSPLSDWRGQGSAKALRNSILLDQDAVAFNRAFFLNDATPAGTLEADDEISEEEYNRLLEQWQIRYRGSSRRFKTAILPKGLHFKPAGLNFTDMGFEKLRKMNLQEQLAAFGVPPVKLGLLEYAKYSNYNLQERTFYQDTMRHKMKKIASGIEKFLAPRFAAQGVFRVAFDMSEYISDEFATRVDTFVKLFNCGVVSRNEMRKELGLGGPVPGGNQFYISSQVTPVGQETLAAIERRALGKGANFGSILDDMRAQLRGHEKTVRDIIREEMGGE